VNEARARLRQKRRGGLLGWFSLSGTTAEIETANSSDPAKEMLRTEEERILWKAVRALPEPYRTPIILRYLSGLASPQIADALRRPAGTVRYQLSRGLQILRERLGSEWTT
jgi:RNA polymerase sigma factor (sigma-70 family)